MADTHLTNEIGRMAKSDAVALGEIMHFILPADTQIIFIIPSRENEIPFIPSIPLWGIKHGIEVRPGEQGMKSINVKHTCHDALVGVALLR